MLRCVGSALSPNGLAFSSEGMLSLALLDRVLDIDEKTQQVTVQAGARVQEVRSLLWSCSSCIQPAACMQQVKLQSGAGCGMRRKQSSAESRQAHSGRP